MKVHFYFTSLISTCEAKWCWSWIVRDKVGQWTSEEPSQFYLITSWWCPVYQIFWYISCSQLGSCYIETFYKNCLSIKTNGLDKTQVICLINQLIIQLIWPQRGINKSNIVLQKQLLNSTFVCLLDSFDSFSFILLFSLHISVTSLIHSFFYTHTFTLSASGVCRWLWSAMGTLWHDSKGCDPWLTRTHTHTHACSHNTLSRSWPAGFRYCLILSNSHWLTDPFTSA